MREEHHGRELVYYVAVSIDGFIADSDGGFDALLAEGDHMAVVVDEYADALPVHARAALGIDAPTTRFDTVVMGWDTLTPALEVGIASPYPHLRQVVASRREREVDPAITLTAEPLATVRGLKGTDGLDIWLCGGGRTAATLLPEIDRLVLKRSPVALGSGIAMFAGAPSRGVTFEPLGARRFGSGVVVEEYVRRG